jgi:hypothetical protein
MAKPVYKPRKRPGPVTEEHTCEKCGSRFSISKLAVPTRDKDSIDCTVCHHELLSWNGGVMYSMIGLIERKENHK